MSSSSSLMWTFVIQSYCVFLLTCSFLLLLQRMQIISPFHSPVALQHASILACHTNSPLFNNSSVLLCPPRTCFTALHCLQTTRQKENLPIFSPLSQPLLRHVTMASRQPLIPILSTSGSRSELCTPLATSRYVSPPSTCLGSVAASRTVLAELIPSEPFPVIDEAVLQCQQHWSQH